MIRRIGVVAAVVGVVAIPAVAEAGKTSPPRDKATGGGQAFLDSRDPAGAGDTVAFTAQRARGATGDSTAATGQVQVNRRGGDAVKFHGVVDCLVVTATNDQDDFVVSKGVGEAYISGYKRGTDPNVAANRFELYVKDGGKGTEERDMDMIALYAPGETADNDDDDTQNSGPCGFDFAPDDGGISLARGNVQVSNANTQDDETPPAPPSDEEDAQNQVNTLAAPLTSLAP